MTKNIRHKVTIGAAPKKVYAALIEEKRHAKFTGEPATISRKVGGAFSCYGGYVSGINLELVPFKRIIQAWRGKGWPAGTYSIATFALAKAAGGKTRLTFTHVGVPSSHAKDINLGWRTFYWKPLKAYLEK
jgi:activator of HSP90 ATPase